MPNPHVFNTIIRACQARVASEKDWVLDITLDACLYRRHGVRLFPQAEFTDFELVGLQL